MKFFFRYYGHLPMSFWVLHSHNCNHIQRWGKERKKERKMTGLSSQALTECQSKLMVLGTASRNHKIIFDFQVLLLISGKCFLFFCPYKCTSCCVPVINMDRHVNPGNNLKLKCLLEKVYSPNSQTFKKLGKVLNRLHYTLLKYLQCKFFVFSTIGK